MKKLVNFLKSRTGLLVLALVAAVVVYYFTTHAESSTVEVSPASSSSEAPTEVVPSTPASTVTTPEAADESPSIGTDEVIPAPASGSTDNPVPGSTDTPDEPVDGEEIHPVNPENNGVKPTPSSEIQKTSIQFDDPTSYYEPTVSSVDRAVWADANRAAPRCDNFRFQTRTALLVHAIN